jgi:hypothetical protein
VLRSSRRLVLVAAVAALVVAGCSSSGEDQVVIDDGTVPPEVTATTATTAVPTTAGGPTTALGPPTLSESSAVTTAGIDTVEFGMSAGEVEVAAGSRVVPADGADTAGCYVATLESGPPGLTLTFSDDTLERLDITEGAVATRSGAGIGDTTQQLRDLFGDQLVEGADPDGEGEALTFVPQDEGDAGTRIIFVIEGDRVASFRAGTRPIVDGGC